YLRRHGDRYGRLGARRHGRLDPGLEIHDVFLIYSLCIFTVTAACRNRTSASIEPRARGSRNRPTREAVDRMRKQQLRGRICVDECPWKNVQAAATHRSAI